MVNQEIWAYVKRQTILRIIKTIARDLQATIPTGGMLYNDIKKKGKLSIYITEKAIILIFT
jgi:hypothetical protein